MTDIQAGSGIRPVTRQPSNVTRRGLRLSSLLGTVVIFLQLAELDSALGYILRLPSSRFMTLTLAALGVIYLLLEIRRVTSLLKVPMVALWLSVLTVLPLLAMAVQLVFGYINLTDFIYWGGFAIVSGILFVMSVNFAVDASDKASRNLFLLSVVAAIFGFLVQQIDYSVIRGIMTFTSNRFAVSSTFARAIGFFSHPNQAAISILFYVTTLVLILIPSGKNAALKALLVLTLAVCLIITGSRTSLFLALVWLMIQGLRFVSASKSISALSSRIVLVFAIVGFTFVSLIAVLPLVGNAGGAAALGLGRITQLFSSIGGDDGASDESASLRATLIGQYFDYSLGSPIIGYGPQASAALVDNDTFTNVSQNSWLQWAIEYGYVYVFSVIAISIWTVSSLLRLSRKHPELRDSVGATLVLMFLIFIATFSLNDIFFTKAILISFGFFIAAIIKRFRKISTEFSSTALAPA